MPAAAPLGIHSRLFRGTAADVARAAAAAGVDCVALTPSFPGLRFDAPADFTSQRAATVAAAFTEAGVRVAELICPGDLLDADLGRRHATVLRLHASIRSCRDFGSAYVVAGTSSATPAGSECEDLCALLLQAASLATQHGVTLLLRPVVGCATTSPDAVARLLDAVESPALGVVMDPGWLLGEEPTGHHPAPNFELFTRLGPASPIVHVGADRLGVASAAGAESAEAEAGCLAILQRHATLQPKSPWILEGLPPGRLKVACELARRRRLG